MAEIPKMLKLAQAAKESGLSYGQLRRLCLDGKIVYRRLGNNILINMDRLADYLNGEDVCEKEDC